MRGCLRGFPAQFIRPVPTPNQKLWRGTYGSSPKPPPSVKIRKRYSLTHNIMAAQVEIYTWSTCPFCIRAKSLLKKKGVDFTEYVIDGDEEARDKMAQRANGGRSVPQIFINDQHLGGCDDIHALDAQGKLDPLLA